MYCTLKHLREFVITTPKQTVPFSFWWTLAHSTSDMLSFAAFFKIDWGKRISAYDIRKRLQISTAAVCPSNKNFAPSGALIWPSALAFALTDLFYPPLQAAIKLCADKPFKYNRLCKEPNAACLGTCLALPIGRPLWNQVFRCLYLYYSTFFWFVNTFFKNFWKIF